MLGGPHANSYPTDSLRFFDLVVHDCDKALVASILDDELAPGSVATSGHVLEEIPSVAERMPEIEIASFDRGRPGRLANIALLASLGCPYTLRLLLDWKNDYVTLPRERLLADLRYVSERLPGIIVSFHDPNFGVRFDEMLDIIEEEPAGRRNPYIMESSLSILRGPRLQRLSETNCSSSRPGVETWADYSNKAGVGLQTGPRQARARGRALRPAGARLRARPAGEFHVRHWMATRGGRACRLTREFVRRLGARLADDQHSDAARRHAAVRSDASRTGACSGDAPRVVPHDALPVTTPKHYAPMEFYDQMIGIYDAIASPRLLLRRLSSAWSAGWRAFQILRVSGAYAEKRRLQELRDRIAGEPELLAFHQGKRAALPAFYRGLLKRRLGRYAELLSDDEVTPQLEPLRGLVQIAQ